MIDHATCDRSLRGDEGDEGRRVDEVAIPANLPARSARGRQDVAHFDGALGELGEESLLVLREVLDDGHVGARRALQRLVAADDALPPPQALEEAVVELVRGFVVQIRGRVRRKIWGTQQHQFLADFAVGGRVRQDS
jgi:hypothetical protein